MIQCRQCLVAGAGGNQTFGNANLTLLDGGAGEDTLSFGESTNEDGVTLSLSTANATNFENIIGTNNAETINGDANSNKLYGSLNCSYCIKYFKWQCW